MVAKINRIIVPNLKKLLLTFCLTAVLSFGANASEPVLLIDDETQNFLEHVVQPIFKAAHIPYHEDHIHILNDMSLNAFVSDGNHLFVHTGTLLKASNVNELSGVLAHEAGHIAGGHILRQKLKLKDMQTLSAVSLIAAGATAVASGRGDAAMAVALGSHSSLLNSLMTYQTQEERSADESAVNYLNKIKQSPLGLKNFMKKIEQTNRLSGNEENPYFRTHPISAERISFFDQAVKKSNSTQKSPYDEEFALVQAKLSAFLLDSNRVKQKYPSSDQSLPAIYAHAIVQYRQKKFTEALRSMDSLIDAKPSNAYFYEFKGQILFESGHIKDAIKTYQKALSIKQDLPETILLYANSVLETDISDRENLQDIINRLNQILTKNPTPEAWQLLSRAYFKKEKQADGFYALAEYSFLTGQIEIAKQQLKKASDLNSSEVLKIKISDLKKQLQEK